MTDKTDDHPVLDYIGDIKKPVHPTSPQNPADCDLCNNLVRVEVQAEGETEVNEVKAEAYAANGTPPADPTTTLNRVGTTNIWQGDVNVGDHANAFKVATKVTFAPSGMETPDPVLDQTGPYHGVETCA